MTVQGMFSDGGILIPLTNAKCKWCGKPFHKHYNEKYCSDHCRKEALREQKAKYQRERRKKIRNGELVSLETEYIGTGFLSARRQEDFDKEQAALDKEKRRIGL